MSVRERSFMPSVREPKADSERQRRNQGYTDGLQGRERRVMGDSVYGEGYRRGCERRAREI